MYIYINIYILNTNLTKLQFSKWFKKKKKYETPAIFYVRY